MASKRSRIPLIIAIIVVIAVIAAGLGYYYYTSKPSPTPTIIPTTPKIEKVVIGIVQPLTGNYAIFGQEAVNAAKLVVDIINNELGGVRSLGGAKLDIARGLMSSPELLLIDEMSLGLAPKIVLSLFDLVGKLNREHGITMLIVEQHVKTFSRYRTGVTSSRTAG